MRNLLRSNVAVALILCGTLLIVLPYICGILFFNYIAEESLKHQLGIYFICKTLIYINLPCILSGIIMILIGIISGLKSTFATKIKKKDYRFLAGAIIFSVIQIINCVKLPIIFLMSAFFNFSSLFYFSVGMIATGLFFEIILHKDFWQRRVSDFRILLGGVTGFIAFQSIKACWMNSSVFWWWNGADSHLSENPIQRFDSTSSWWGLLFPILVMGIPITISLINAKRAKSADFSEKDALRVQSNRKLIFAVILTLVSAFIVWIIRVIFSDRLPWFDNWPFDVEHPIICIFTLHSFPI